MSQTSRWPSGGSGGTVTSVAMTVPSILTLAGSPITSSGTLALSLATQAANLVLAGPTTGAAATPTFRSLVITDLPTLSASLALVSSAGGVISTSAVTATELGYVSGVTSAVQTQLNAKATHVIPSTNQMVYVTYLTGDDSTGDGSYDKPYKTVAHALVTITDATQNKPYVIALQAARQIETTDVLIKPYTFIVGMEQRASYIRINGGGQFKPDATFGTASNGWCGFKNLYVGGSTVINFDLPTYAAAGSNALMIIENCTLSGAVTFKGRNAGGGDFLEMYVGLVIGAMTLDSVSYQIQSYELGGAVAITNSTAVASLSGTMDNVVIDTSMAVDGQTAYLNNIAYAGTSTLTTTNTVVLDSFRGLPPTSRRTLSGGTTVTSRDNATMEPYTPATPANWATSSPTNVQLALDRMAALLVTLNGSAPIP